MAALMVNRHQRRHVKRHASKLQPYPSAVDRQHGILDPIVGPKVFCGLVMAIRQPNAARVEVNLWSGADPAYETNGASSGSRVVILSELMNMSLFKIFVSS